MKIDKLLFYFQMACAAVFATSQALKMFESTEGVSLGFFLCHGAFAFLNLSLSVVALRETTKDAVDHQAKKQSVHVYTVWCVILLLHVGIALYQKTEWKVIDSVTLSIVATGSLLVVAYALILKIPLMDAQIKAMLAIFFKCIPQLTLAIVIYQHGKGGLSGIWILFGHITIITRIVHLRISNRKGWNRNTLASFRSEVVNELSWIVATVAFIIF